MSSAEWWEFVRTQGVQTREVVTAVFGVLFLGIGVYSATDTARLMQKPRARLNYSHLLGPLSWLGIGTLCLLVVWHLTRERYLLREGASRYTVAWVYEYGSQRGFHTFLYRYRVAGYDGQGYLRCGVSYGRALPCPPLGTRFYVQFSSEEPAVEQITQLEVPDTVRTVPPLGWARLPE